MGEEAEIWDEKDSPLYVKIVVKPMASSTAEEIEHRGHGLTRRRQSNISGGKWKLKWTRRRRQGTEGNRPLFTVRQ